MGIQAIFKLVYKPSSILGRADSLSQLPHPAIEVHDSTPANLFMLEQAYPDVLSPEVYRHDTERDPMLSHVAEAVLTESPLPVGGDWGNYTTKANKLSLHERCLLWGVRVIVL